MAWLAWLAWLAWPAGGRTGVIGWVLGARSLLTAALFPAARLSSAKPATPRNICLLLLLLLLLLMLMLMLLLLLLPLLHPRT